jgi:hypothetical protein
MRKAIMGLVISIFALIIPFALSAQSPQGNGLDVVKLVIASDGKILGKPELVMQPGSSAVATVASEDGYSIKVVSRRMPDPADRSISIEYYAPLMDKWSLVGKPNVQTRLGQDVDLILKTPDGRDLRISLKVSRLEGPVKTSGYRKN